MGSLSKTLPYSCYELGHCFKHSCSAASFEVCIIGFLESLKIYGVVYLLTGLVNARKISVKYGKKLLKDYITSACFLTVNAFGYIGSFCVLRHVLRHFNFLTVSFAPGFIGSLMAILVERPERRTLLAIYVTNVASECLWNSAVGHGYVSPIPRGEIMIFAAGMAYLGYSFRSQVPASRLINSIMQLFLGQEESGVMMAQRKAPTQREGIAPEPLLWHQRLLAVITGKHWLCPHPGGCLPRFVGAGVQGFVRGLLLQLSVKLVVSVPSLVRAPGRLAPLLTSKTNIQAGLFLGWFTALFKGTCCAGRRWHGEDRAAHGTVAGALAALSMYFYSAPSLALYMMWKVVESMYEQGWKAGYLPRIPGSVELLYALSTGYLFHMAAVEQYHMKPSYWRFLCRLTSNRIVEYNRHLLAPFKMDSARNFSGIWPDYDLRHVSETVKRLQWSV
ncbi:Transmembrane protein 135 [Chionoecetes opilio]|uniref:Transmembrane protein 135 n=1 Tax=Chionoecetes opilio TaxID=41210 RepID=A0A8J5CR07_CHIOP|nr:Transmembrane protein 135 [Chionoecetes opilio]KAG0719284.1 Transmembrane protein 135 [Chionoecetes opilio]